jgi:hypothetical protein
MDAVGVADNEEDGAHAVAGGYGAAGDDGERRSVSGDRDEAEVGFTGSEFGGAFGGGVGGQGVAGGEGGTVRFVVEGPHEGCGIEEMDGGDAEGHRVVYVPNFRNPAGAAFA